MEASPLYRLYIVTATTLRRLVLFNALASALATVIAFRYGVGPEYFLQFWADVLSKVQIAML
jgi:hypothetical protein